MVIYTDDSITTFIIKRIKLTTNNSDKFNFRFVRVSIYFSQFEFDVKYKPGKFHVIPDVLFRLFKNTPLIMFSTPENIFDNVYYVGFIVENEFEPIFNNIFVMMANDFKMRSQQRTGKINNGNEF